eukprot:gene16389-5004_t
MDAGVCSEGAQDRSRFFGKTMVASVTDLDPVGSDRLERP